MRHFADFEQVVSHFDVFEQVIIKISHFADFEQEQNSLGRNRMPKYFYMFNSYKVSSRNTC